MINRDNILANFFLKFPDIQNISIIKNLVNFYAFMPMGFVWFIYLNFAT